jgi:hypothetical protein
LGFGWWRFLGTDVGLARKYRQPVEKQLRRGDPGLAREISQDMLDADGHRGAGRLSNILESAFGVLYAP